MPRNRVFTFLLSTSLVALVACSSGQVDSLKSQVSALRREVASLETKVAEESSAEQSLRDCIDELRGVIHDLASEVAYVGSTRMVGGLGEPFLATACGQGVLAKADLATVHRQVIRANATVARVFRERLFATIPPPDGSTSGTNGPTALCNDGTYSYSQHAQGTCSWHDGVSEWINYPG
jgi:hypothetical protein